MKLSIADGNEMKMRLVWFVVACNLIPFAGSAQTSRVLPWEPTSQTDGRRVYRPEPILFVHGINANDGGWPTAINALKTSFQKYYLVQNARDMIEADNSSNRYRATQENYLHTFNYGDLPGASTRDRQSFDTIRWNAWAADRDSWPLTNPYRGAQQNHPTGNRQTLDERINGRVGAGAFLGIRDAYAITIGGVTHRAQVVLIAHSMGGLLSHYYLVNKPTDHGVRRLVTVATPHLGSDVANCKGTSV